MAKTRKKVRFFFSLLIVCILTVAFLFRSSILNLYQKDDISQWKTYVIKGRHLKFEAPKDAKITTRGFTFEEQNSTAKEPKFIDNTGYFYQNGKWYVKFGPSRNYRVDAHEIVNPYGFKILKVVGKNLLPFGKSVLGTPEKGWLGATSNYPGFTVEMETGKYAENTFNKILLSARYYVEWSKAMSIDISEWKTYTNNVGKFSIQYPPDWIIQESHKYSNREVDDPKEINTATLSGRGGEVILQWGPMGFGGGGCPEHFIQLKDAVISGCRVKADDGLEYWGQIYSPNPDREPAFGARAQNNPAIGDTVERIFSTLKFY